MKLSQDAKTALEKLPEAKQQQVIKLVSQRIVIDEMKRRMSEQGRMEKKAK